MHSAFESLKYEPQKALEKDSDNVTPLHWACLVRAAVILSMLK